MVYKLEQFLLASKECPIHENYKQAILKAKDTSTTVTGRINGTPVRILKNKMAKAYIQKEKAGADMMELEKYTLGSLKKAVFEGNVDEGSLMAGQVAGMIHEIKPVKQILERNDEVSYKKLIQIWRFKMLEINQKSLTVPLIQGGMGVGVSLGNLAGHVAKCGAMGVISTAHPGYKEDDFESNHRQANIRALKKEILKAQKLSQGKRFSSHQCDGCFKRL